MMKKVVVYIVVAMLLASAAAILYLDRDTGDATGQQTDRSMPQSGGQASGVNNSVAPKTFITGLEQLPSSLRDTDPPPFMVDSNGHLVIARSVRDAFDYFLSAVGEEPVETIVARIRAYIHQVLKGKPAEAEALHILDGYIDYKKALTTITAQAPESKNTIDVAAIRRQMDQVQALRVEFLSPEVIQAFFGDDDAYDRYTMARIELSQKKNLSADERARQLAALEQQLPQTVQENLKTAKQFQSLQELVDDCKKRNCPDTELHQQREALVGPEAEERLETLDRQNAAWDARMNTWISQRTAILGNKSISEMDRQQQITDQRNTLFTTQEQVEVKGLEEIHDEGPAAQAASLPPQ